MTRYSKMQAPPFWMAMFRIAGIFCLVTLLTPTAYLLKYVLQDRPVEEKIAETASSNNTSLAQPAFAHGTEWYIRDAEGKQSPGLRTLAVQRLGDLAKSPMTQIAYPVECLHAKLALELVADADPDTAVRTAARTTLMSVAQHGAVIQR